MEPNDLSPGLAPDSPRDKAWTVVGVYRDEELADGGLSEGRFVMVFYAPTAQEAEACAIGYEPWLTVAAVLEGADHPID